MRVQKYKVLLFSLVSLLVFSCVPKAKPTSERINKVWTVKSVTENGVEVYKAGAATNVRGGYSTYKLDLSKPPAVTLREFDGNTFTGTYKIPAENKLSLEGLTPPPSSTGGTLEYTLSFVSDTEITLTGTAPYPKTGTTTNVYVLTSGI
jgi:asparagine N-glycosylation enzyme membrane subunit Stt3